MTGPARSLSSHELLQARARPRGHATPRQLSLLPTINTSRKATLPPHPPFNVTGVLVPIVGTEGGGVRGGVAFLSFVDCSWRVGCGAAFHPTYWKTRFEFACICAAGLLLLHGLYHHRRLALRGEGAAASVRRGLVSRRRRGGAVVGVLRRSKRVFPAANR